MEKENNKLNNKVIETYAEDMASVIGDDQGGLIKKIIHEQEMKELEKKKLSPVSKKNRLYMINSLAFVLAAFIILMFFISNKGPETVVVEEQFVPLVFNDTNFFIETNDLTKEQVIASVLSQVNNSTVKKGGLEGIYLTKNQVTMGLRDFLTLMKGNVVLPEELFVSDKFLLGLVNNDTKDLFFLIKVRSFLDIFQTMKSWEKKMFYDLYSFFEFSINMNTNYLLTKDFEDGVVENKNARVLFDKDGNVAIMYVFADENSIIITNKMDAAREVMRRLASGKLRK
mgnify:CR=1 FL=1